MQIADSVLRVMKFCLHLLPLGAIHNTIILAITSTLMTHTYISYKSKDALESLTKFNMCFSDIIVHVIKKSIQKLIDDFSIYTFEARFE